MSEIEPVETTNLAGAIRRDALALRVELTRGGVDARQESGVSLRLSHRRITGTQAAPPATCRITMRRMIAIGIPAISSGRANPNGEPSGSASIGP